jgi:hypothetical protein
MLIDPSPRQQEDTHTNHKLLDTTAFYLLNDADAAVVREDLPIKLPKTCPTHGKINI